MPAWQNRQPRVQPRKIATENRSCTVSARGTSGLAGYGHASRSISVCLRTRKGMPGRFGTTASIVPSSGTTTYVELRHVDGAADRQSPQQLVAAAGTVLGLPLPDHVGDREHDLLTVAEDGGVEEVGDRLGVERRVATREHDRVVVAAVDRVQRDAGEVEGVEHVRVAELGPEAQAKYVERAHGAVAVDGELRDVALAHDPLHVGPHRVRALGEDPVALVEDFVEDLHALVGQADLVGVGVHQSPPHRRALGSAVPVLDRGVQLAPDVLDRLLHGRKLRLQAREDAGDGHGGDTSEGRGSETIS